MQSRLVAGRQTIVIAASDAGGPIGELQLPPTLAVNGKDYGILAVLARHSLSKMPQKQYITLTRDEG